MPVTPIYAPASSVWWVEPTSTFCRIAAWIVSASVPLIGMATVRPPRSRMPRTGVLPSGLELFIFMLVGLLAADKRFVDFDDALKLAKVFAAAGFPQSMQDEPSRLLRDPNLF